MRAHLLLFNDAQADRKDIQGALDAMPAVVNWYRFFNNTLCLASDATAAELSREIRSKLPYLNCTVTTIDAGRRAGWMPKGIWTFLDAPGPVQVEPV